MIHCCSGGKTEAIFWTREEIIEKYDIAPKIVNGRVNRDPDVASCTKPVVAAFMSSSE